MERFRQENNPSYSEEQKNQSERIEHIKQKERDLFYEKIEEHLASQEGSLTDDELVSVVESSANESGLSSSPFENTEERPKVFYRVLPRSEAVEKLISRDEFNLRPFSYTAPGKKGSVPLSYGGGDPVVFRVVDTTGEWEATEEYWESSPKTEKNWNEAMNLDPVVLTKVDSRSLNEGEIYRQVGSEVAAGETVLQVTFVVNKEKTSELQARNSLETFKEDAGFFEEIKDRASYFSSGAWEKARILNKKYFEYFDKTMRIDENSVSNKIAKKTIILAQEEIAELVFKLQNVSENDRNWKEGEIQELLGIMSEKSLQIIAQIRRESLQ